MVCHMLSTFRILCREEIVYGSLMLDPIINLLEWPREQRRLRTEILFLFISAWERGQIVICH